MIPPDRHMVEIRGEDEGNAEERKEGAKRCGLPAIPACRVQRHREGQADLLRDQHACSLQARHQEAGRQPKVMPTKISVMSRRIAASRLIPTLGKTGARWAASAG